MLCEDGWKVSTWKMRKQFQVLGNDYKLEIRDIRQLTFGEAKEMHKKEAYGISFSW